MAKLIAYTNYAEAQAHCSARKLWELFDGNKKSFNIGQECVDRHASDPERLAVIVVGADGSEERISFRQLSILSNQFANLLVEKGIKSGDRVAVMLRAVACVLRLDLRRDEVWRCRCSVVYAVRPRWDPAAS